MGKCKEGASCGKGDGYGALYNDERVFGVEEEEKLLFAVGFSVREGDLIRGHIEGAWWGGNRSLGVAFWCLAGNATGRYGLRFR